MMQFIVLIFGREVAEAVKDLDQQLKNNEFQKLLETAESDLKDFPGDAKLTFFRASALEGLGKTGDALKDFAFVVSKMSPYKFRAILKLKTLCFSECAFECDRQIPAAVLGQELLGQLQNLSNWRRTAIENRSVPELELLSHKCLHDAGIQKALLESYLQNNNFENAKLVFDTLHEFSSNNDIFASLGNIYDTLHQIKIFRFQDINIDNVADEQARLMIKLFSKLLIMIEDNSPISRRPSDKEIADASDALGQLNDQLITNGIRYFEQLAAKNIVVVFADAKVELKSLISNLNTYIPLATVVISYYKGEKSMPHNFMVFPEPTVHHRLCKSITQILDTQPLGKPLFSRLEKNEDVESELSALEYQCENVRKGVNRIKFGRINDLEIPQVDAFLDDINLIFDQVVQIRLKALQPNFFALLECNAETPMIDVKKNYYRIAKDLHPDNYEADITPEEKKLRQRKFQRIAEAYSVLVDKEKKQQYIMGIYGSDERSQRLSIHNNRKKNSYTVPPDYKGSGKGLDDDELRKFMNDEQWREYQREKRAGRA